MVGEVLALARLTELTQSCVEAIWRLASAWRSLQRRCGLALWGLHCATAAEQPYRTVRYRNVVRVVVVAGAGGGRWEADRELSCTEIKGGVRLESGRCHGVVGGWAEWEQRAAACCGCAAGEEEQETAMRGIVTHAQMPTWRE